MVKKNTEDFPSDRLSSEEKSTSSYHLQYVKAAWDEYNTKSYFGSRSDKKRRMYELKQLAQGIIDVDQFKNQITQDDTSYLNLNYDVQSPLPKFVRILVNETLSSGGNIKAYSLDPTAKTRFDLARNKMIADRVLAKVSAQYRQHSGHDFMEGKEIAQSNEEIDLKMETNFKLDEELEMEQAVQAIFKENRFDAVSKTFLTNQAALKIGASRITVDENNDIRIRAVDPLNLIMSPGQLEDFSDRRYIGEEIYVKLYDIRKKLQDEGYSEKEIAQAAEQNYGRGFPFRNYIENAFLDRAPYDSQDVRVVDLEWKSTHKVVYEKKWDKFGGFVLIRREEDYKLPKESKYKRDLIIKEFRLKHTCKWVVGTEMVYDYGVDENLLKEQTHDWYSFDVPFSFVVYAPDIYLEDNKSLIEQSKFAAEQICLLQLKIQQHIVTSRPQGVALDTSAVQNVIQGTGEDFLKPLEVAQLYNELGIMLFSSQREDYTTIQNSKPVFELDNKMSTDLERLVNLYNHYVNTIRDIFGINEYRDGSTPSQDTLNGVMEKAIQASNNATYDFKDTYKKFVEQNAKIVSLYLQDLVERGVKEFAFKNIIGEEGVKSIKLSENVALSEFGIYFEFNPDAQEIMNIEKMVEIGVQRDQIGTDDALFVKRLAKKSTKLAERYLKYARNKYQEKQAELSRQQQEANAMVQQKSIQAQAQAKMQELQLESQAKLMEIEAKKQADLEVENLKGEWQFKIKNLEMQLKKQIVQESIEADNRQQEKPNPQKSGGKDEKIPGSTGTSAVRQPSV